MEEEMLEENWKPVVGYEEWYEASDLGNIKRVKNGQGTIGGNTLVPCVSDRGYYIVCLCKNGKQKTPKVHHLVAGAFIGKRKDGMEVNHKDGDKLNNHPKNLEYVTRSENMLHVFAVGLKSHKGENNPSNKLTEEDVREIRLLLPKYTQTEIGKRFNVSQSAISLIAVGKNWSYLKEPDDLTNTEE